MYSEKKFDYIKVCVYFNLSNIEDLRSQVYKIHLIK